MNRSILLLLALMSSRITLAWERGNHAGDWTKGATIKVFVDPTPAGAPAGTDKAVTDAIKEWNDAQAPFGGLMLMTTGADKTNSEIHISWGKLADLGGGVTDAAKGADAGFTKDTVKVKIPFDGGLNSNGVTRILKHELGHAEGLGHSEKSDLMKADAYSSKPGSAPSVADINKDPPFTPPTDDDKAGKKSLWGTVEKLIISTTDSSTSFNGSTWFYDYTIRGVLGTSVITDFTVNLLSQIASSNFTVTSLPPGWHFQFFSGNVTTGEVGPADGEMPSPSLLSFMADSPFFGITAGQMVHFQIASTLPPGLTRAFTNSTSFDSDESKVLAPAIPEPAPLALVGTGLIALFGLRRKQRSTCRGSNIIGL